MTGTSKQKAASRASTAHQIIQQQYDPAITRDRCVSSAIEFENDDEFNASDLEEKTGEVNLEDDDYEQPEFGGEDEVEISSDKEDSFNDTELIEDIDTILGSSNTPRIKSSIIIFILPFPLFQISIFIFITNGCSIATKSTS
ncbi:hypothetical protein OCU04_005025 [Sclerotinia nivalis]|uniref:Uncharacterized protein n=1 Tax=Sclerotinia nivalis TaxID=352851 RepID=A0A9X0DME3_9HELO|nr:hypothetical protein OCU04_005025 [Sclerotinia nivalis]